MTAEPIHEPTAGATPEIAIGEGDGQLRYLRPDWLTNRVFNPMIEWLARRGISIRGSQILEVQGRRTGKWYSTPVNPLTLGDTRYLVAARGHTQWVRNARANATVRLRLGRQVDEVTLVEIDAAERPVILREYLSRWRAEVGKFFDGVDANSDDQGLARIAPDHPVFRVATW